MQPKGMTEKLGESWMECAKYENVCYNCIQSSFLLNQYTSANVHIYIINF